MYIAIYFSIKIINACNANIADTYEAYRVSSIGIFAWGEVVGGEGVHGENFSTL